MYCSPPGFSLHGIARQEYWREVPFPTPGDLPDPGIKPEALAPPVSAGRFFTIVPPGKSKANILGLRLCWVNSREVALEEKRKQRREEGRANGKKKRGIYEASPRFSLFLYHTHTRTHTQLISNCGKLKFWSPFFTLYLCIQSLCFTALQFSLMANYVFRHIDYMLECAFSSRGHINRHGARRHTHAMGSSCVLSLFSHMSDSSGPKG